MRFFGILLFATIVTFASAETTNTLRLEQAKKEATELSKGIREAQDNLLRLEGMIATLQAIVAEESTTGSLSTDDAVTTR